MMLGVKIERRFQAFGECDAWSPAERLLNFAEVTIIIADVDRLAVGWERDFFVAASGVQAAQEIG